jgi:uncharacterized Fe-S cluster protein YjdI/CDGSH-type Zn-finger protein
VAEPKRRAYTGEGVTVYYDAARCIHYAECVRGLPAVFDTHQRPWIQPAHAAIPDVAEVVRRCPSGALSYELADGPAEVPERPTAIRLETDGPLLLRGELSIETAGGTESDTRAALCRCGLTANQPFCDHECRHRGWQSRPST